MSLLGIKDGLRSSLETYRADGTLEARNAIISWVKVDLLEPQHTLFFY